MHKSLPIQNRMRGCTLNNAGEVVKYLGTYIWAESDTNGTYGNVMVEVPEHWVKVINDGTKIQIKVSDVSIDGFKRIPRYYVSAYEASMNREEDQLVSLANKDPKYRGGNNDSTYDSTEYSLLGKPATATSRVNFRVAARKGRNANWNILTSEIYTDINILYLVEYANNYSQLDFYQDRDNDNMSRGGLGIGLSIVNYNAWVEACKANPLVDCGYTDTSGNRSVIKGITLPTEIATTRQLLTRYRGIENLYGHLYKMLDGCIASLPPIGSGLSKFYMFNNPEKYADVINADAKYVSDFTREQGYIKEVNMTEDYILPTSVGGSSTSYYTDFFYTTTNNSANLITVPLVLGTAHLGSSNGIFCSSITYSIGNSTNFIGTRLVYLTEY